MAESTALLDTPQTAQRRRFKYRFQFIRSGAALVIVLDTLMRLFQACLLYSAKFLHLHVHLDRTLNGSVNNMIMFMAVMLFPIFGLIADMCVGRYRMILGSILFSLVAWSVMVVVVTVSCVYTETHSALFAYIFLPLLWISLIGLAGFLSIVIPFNVDQLMGASGDELSATIYWHAFTGIIPAAVFVPLDYYLPLHVKNLCTILMIHLSIGGISLVLALSILFIFNHWLDVTPQFYNPVKLIFQVLNYARKNKYPRNRSALTYWENSVPSRLDLGKDKYGGPFTVEQVEDVRTVLRLLPILISAIWLGYNNLYLDLLPFVKESVFIWFVEGSAILYDVFIVVHLFILYPCCSKYIPSMLKRISFGLVFGFLTTLGYIMIQSINLASSKLTSISVTIDYKWMIIPGITNSLAIFLLKVTSLEFLIAQSPKSMRGLMVGLWYASIGFGSLIYHFMVYMLLVRDKFNIYSLFYLTIVDFAIILLVLIIFVIIAKYYKLRIRENIVPVTQIAEEHYERYREQSDEYRRDRELSYTDSY